MNLYQRNFKRHSYLSSKYYITEKEKHEFLYLDDWLENYSNKVAREEEGIEK
jgi:hypothetical protein